MTYTQDDFIKELAKDFTEDKEKPLKKKRLAALLDKYGESRENIDKNADITDWMEYIFAQGDKYLDEVIQERAMTRYHAQFPQTPISLKSLQDSEYKISKNLPETENENTFNSYKQPEKKKKKTPEETYLNDDFYHKLAMEESTDDYSQHLDDKKGIGALGKYQLRMPALQDTGYIDKKGKFTGKDNISSIADFLKNPIIQEKAVKELANKNYNYLKHYDVLDKEGISISGKIENFKITIPGMLAAAHKEGASIVAKYLNSLEKNEKGEYYLPYDKYKGNTLRSLLAVETRLRKFEK